MHIYCVILVTVSVKVFCIITCEYLTNAWNAKTTSNGVAQLLHMWQKKLLFNSKTRCSVFIGLDNSC